MRIYKLKYNTTEEGIADLLDKGVVGVSWTPPTNAVVDLGDGCFDIMSEIEDLVFESEIFPETPNHEFSGHQETDPEDIIES